MYNLNNLIVPKFIDEAITPVAKEAGDRLSDVVNLVCTPIIMARKYRDLKLELFFDDLREKLRKIPEDRIVNPPVDVVGPVLENVTKFYYDREDLRKLFAQLIATSMDKKNSSKVHPAFIEVIKQLTPNDAIILNSRLLYTIEDMDSVPTFAKLGHPICDVVYQHKKTHEIVHYAEKNVFFFQDYFNSMDRKQFYQSLDNLTRLNIISVDRTSSKIDDFLLFKEFENSQLLQDFESYKLDSVFYSTEYEVSLVKKVLILTDFGLNFIETCIG
jgi:hypothetical protein